MEHNAIFIKCFYFLILKPKRVLLQLCRSVRRFYITNHYGGCTGELGWLAVVEAQVYCSYDEMDHYPIIRYSDAKSKIKWSDGYGIADSMAIFISLRQQEYPGP
ncbi:uncharacterized protein LOC118768584 [Octopus sinensis]|uniref:Uncharacterized protein LOC118768584 n=1 Tax=Octopus sinensis TaxID=2607531 RepID=A0A7E6FUA6_9MOLL|nr:uncharacterized protein LOC118768584 [Octopus sinensis]